MDGRVGKSHRARKRLFARGLKRRYLTVAEIEEALPGGVLTAAERWLLYYSLIASGVEIRGDVDDLRMGLPIVRANS